MRTAPGAPLCRSEAAVRAVQTVAFCSVLELNHAERQVIDIEAALAHVVRNRVEAAYRRTDLFDRRRRLMDDWAAYLAGER